MIRKILRISLISVFYISHVVAIASADEFNSNSQPDRETILGVDPSICNDPQIKKIEAQTGTTARVYPPGSVSRAIETQLNTQTGVCNGTNGIVEFIPTPVFKAMKAKFDEPLQPLQGGVNQKVKKIPNNPVLKPITPKLDVPENPNVYPGGVSVPRPIEGGGGYNAPVKTQFLCSSIQLIDRNRRSHNVRFRIGPQFQSNHRDQYSMGGISPMNGGYRSALGYMITHEELYLDRIVFLDGSTGGGISLRLSPCK
jgi:hypothetical protein